jgi:DnaJ homolog subfamily C member 14
LLLLSSYQNGRNGTFQHGFRPSEGGDEGPSGLSRRIACKKCGDFHLWIYTGRAKLQARWCQVFFVLYNGYFYTTIHNCLEITVMLFISQDCREFHQAKDGDGWVEQSFQPILFGMLHKVNARLFQPLTSVILHLSFQGKQMICSILSLF